MRLFSPHKLIFMVLLFSSFCGAQCSNTDYGHGVRCISGAGGGSGANASVGSIGLSPTVGHGVTATVYQCFDSTCTLPGTTTLTIGTDLTDPSPEPCFQKSPNSPYALVETSPGAQHLQDYIWYCPSIPSGVSALAVRCSVANACSYITIIATEWTGLATSGFFDCEGGGASTSFQGSLSVFTSPCNFTNDLVLGYFDNTTDTTMACGSPYLQANQFFAGNIQCADTLTSTGVQNMTASWGTPLDDWYGVIVGIKSLTSVGSANHEELLLHAQEAVCRPPMLCAVGTFNR